MAHNPGSSAHPIPTPDFWRDKRVFITGHTGFKGSWLSLILARFGAKITGYALTPPTEPSLFVDCQIPSLLEESHIADIRDEKSLTAALQKAAPEIVFHMAAQPLVRESYLAPVDTFAANVMGTAHLLNAVRSTASVRVIVNITTDKVYKNKEWLWPYRENDRLGGDDPYSASKACAEIVAHSFRHSFFNMAKYAEHKVAMGTVRAGNVIGGGDWAKDRLIPDCVRAYLQKEVLPIRYPHAIRPWQHVLEPLRGYMMLAERLHADGPNYFGEWNFGPQMVDCKPVSWIIAEMAHCFGNDLRYEISGGTHFHEAGILMLDHTKAEQLLHWSPRWDLQAALAKVVEWTLAYQQRRPQREICYQQIDEYFGR